MTFDLRHDLGGLFGEQDVKTILGVSTLALVLSMGTAFAADLPTRKAAPAPLVAPAFTWTGCYAGMNAGALGSSAHFSGLNTSVDNQARIAVQAGCNYQINQWVVGAEGELSEAFWNGQGGRFNQDIALRGGYAIDRTLIFGKVGAGFSDSKFGIRFPALNLVEHTTQERVGLLLGGGVEYAIDRHWSVKGEFDYIDYGSRNFAFTGAQPLNIGVSTKQIIGDVGFNYHF